VQRARLTSIQILRHRSCFGRQRFQRQDCETDRRAADTLSPRFASTTRRLISPLLKAFKNFSADRLSHLQRYGNRGLRGLRSTAATNSLALLRVRLLLLISVAAIFLAVFVLNAQFRTTARAIVIVIASAVPIPLGSVPVLVATPSFTVGRGPCYDRDLPRGRDAFASHGPSPGHRRPIRSPSPGRVRKSRPTSRLSVCG
jgi:hypothetical protein